MRELITLYYYDDEFHSKSNNKQFIEVDFIVESSSETFEGHGFHTIIDTEIKIINAFHCTFVSKGVYNLKEVDKEVLWKLEDELQRLDLSNFI